MIARELETSEGTVRNRVNQMVAEKVLRIMASMARFQGKVFDQAIKRPHSD